MKAPISKSTKKPYETPVLSEYGDIREMTQNVGSKGAMGDGGSNPNNKTA